jgi:hypothetical protein
MARKPICPVKGKFVPTTGFTVTLMPMRSTITKAREVAEHEDVIARRRAAESEVVPPALSIDAASTSGNQ